MTDRLITHLRHVDLAVPDYATQLDFYTSTWGLTAEHTDSGLSFLAAEGSPEQYVVRLRQAADKRIDLISFGAANAADVDALAEPARARRRPAGARAAAPCRPPAAATASGSSTTRAAPSRSAPTSRCGSTARSRRASRSRSGSRTSSSTRADPEGTRAFYEKHLGFALSDTLMHPRMGEMMWFLRINAWHHSLAIARGPHPSLHHASFEMRGIDEYMRGHRPAAARRRREDLGPRPAPGRQQHLQLLPRPARQHRRVHDRARAGRRGHLAPARLRLQRSRGHRPVGHGQPDERVRRQAVLQRPRPGPLRGSAGLSRDRTPMKLATFEVDGEAGGPTRAGVVERRGSPPAAGERHRARSRAVGACSRARRRRCRARRACQAAGRRPAAATASAADRARLRRVRGARRGRA